MAIENEVAEYIADHKQIRDVNGHHLIVRNGHLSARTTQAGVGPVEVQQPRVNDKQIDENGQRIHFSSKILAPYLQRTKSIDELIPWLYLKGISTGNFTEALQALLGPQACPGGLISNQHRPSQEVLAAGMGRLVEAFTGGQVLRLSLGCETRGRWFA